MYCDGPGLSISYKIEEDMKTLNFERKKSHTARFERATKAPCQNQSLTNVVLAKHGSAKQKKKKKKKRLNSGFRDILLRYIILKYFHLFFSVIIFSASHPERFPLIKIQWNLVSTYTWL